MNRMLQWLGYVIVICTLEGSKELSFEIRITPIYVYEKRPPEECIYYKVKNVHVENMSELQVIILSILNSLCIESMCTF